MKTEIDATDRIGSQMFHASPAATPSLRVPVTGRNRDLLRRLRAAEACAWEEADQNPQRRTLAQAFLYQTVLPQFATAKSNHYNL